MHLKTAGFAALGVFLSLSMVVGFAQPVRADEIHSFVLTSPPTADERAYLGITKDTFRLADVQADIVIVELFSLYCGLCVKEAPAVAELFSLAKKQSTPQRRIVLVGLGAGNNAKEVASFKTQNSVPFPLVPDQKMTVARSMKMVITPAFVAFKKQPDGSLVRLHTRPGVLGPPQRFLDSALQAAAKLP